MKSLLFAVAGLVALSAGCTHATHATPEAPGQTVIIDSSLSLSDVQEIIAGVDSWSTVANVHPKISLRDHDEMAREVSTGHFAAELVYVFGKNGLHSPCPRVGDANWRNPHADYEGWTFTGMTIMNDDRSGSVMCLTVDAPAGSVSGGLAGLAAHEFGHALHLDHAASAAKVMFADSAVKAALPTCEDARDLASLDEGYGPASGCE